MVHGKYVDWGVLRKSFFCAVLFIIFLVVFDLGNFTGYLVQNEQKLIFVELNIPPEYERPYPGGTVLVETSILQRGVGVEDSTPIDLEYSIKDIAGNTIAKKEARSALATKLSGVTSLLIPTTVQPGVYIAAVKVTTTDGTTAVGSKTFEIRKKDGENSFLLIGVYSFMILFLILVLTFLFYRFFRNQKKGLRYRVRHFSVRRRRR